MDSVEQDGWDCLHDQAHERQGDVLGKCRNLNFHKFNDFSSKMAGDFGIAYLAHVCEASGACVDSMTHADDFTTAGNIPCPPVYFSRRCNKCPLGFVKFIRRSFPSSQNRPALSAFIQ